MERVLEVMTWFYRQTEEGGILYNEDAHQAEDFEKIEVSYYYLQTPVSWRRLQLSVAIWSIKYIAVVTATLD